MMPMALDMATIDMMTVLILRFRILITSLLSLRYSHSEGTGDGSLFPNPVRERRTVPCSLNKPSFFKIFSFFLKAKPYNIFTLCGSMP